ncbi:MAG: hypothetical protein GY792_07635 [Gammaproteobacteria bacterium]|nr:hypothetical protein [Gammaproteobacteria bacterium]
MNSIQVQARVESFFMPTSIAPQEKDGKSVFKPVVRPNIFNDLWGFF